MKHCNTFLNIFWVHCFSLKNIYTLFFFPFKCTVHAFIVHAVNHSEKWLFLSFYDLLEFFFRWSGNYWFKSVMICSTYRFWLKNSSTSFTLVVLINIWIRVVSCKYQYCIYMYNLSCNVHISIKEHFTVCFYKWILKYQCTPFYEQFNCWNL